MELGERVAAVETRLGALEGLAREIARDVRSVSTYVVAERARRIERAKILKRAGAIIAGLVSGGGTIYEVFGGFIEKIFN